MSGAGRPRPADPSRRNRHDRAIRRDVQCLRGQCVRRRRVPPAARRVLQSSTICSCCSATRCRRAYVRQLALGRAGPRNPQRSDAGRTQRVRRRARRRRSPPPAWPVCRWRQRRPYAAVRRHRLHVAPGSTREEFLAEPPPREHRDGGAHGGRGRLLVEIYGAIANHWTDSSASSATTRPGRTCRRRESASALLLPFQFMPGVVAVRMKQAEAARIGRYPADAHGYRSRTPAESPAPAGQMEPRRRDHRHRFALGAWHDSRRGVAHIVDGPLWNRRRSPVRSDRISKSPGRRSSPISPGSTSRRGSDAAGHGATRSPCSRHGSPRRRGTLTGLEPRSGRRHVRRGYQ